MDTNLNIAACIEHTNNFGSTVVHNICNGTTQVVPWGSLDWAGCLLVAAFLLGAFSIAGITIWVCR